MIAGALIAARAASAAGPTSALPPRPATVASDPATAHVRSATPHVRSATLHVRSATLHVRSATAHRRLRPGHADWERIRVAAHLRALALAPGRTTYFRTFTAYLGLSELASIRRLAPGRCSTAIRDLYDNLLDLYNAYPGENWAPLRRAVAREPSIKACAPRGARRHSR